MHACIEKHTKHREIYTEKQWGEMMAAACVKNPYSVKHLKRKQFFDLKNFAENFKWKSVSISQVREICIDPTSKNPIKIVYDFDQAREPARIFKNSIDYKNLVKNYKFPIAYHKKIQLPEKKKQDLLTMVNKKWIPPIHKDFYMDIIR